MVGAGQLARMTHQAAVALGQSLRVLAEGPVGPAALVARDVVVGRPDDLTVLRRFAQGCDVITFDHEHVPTEHLRALVAEGVQVYPGPDALVHAQDKLLMRQTLAGLGMPVPPFLEVIGLQDALCFGAEHGWPCVLKAIRGGYDGRGVWTLNAPSDARRVVAELLAADTPLLIEPYVAMRRELAALVARSPFGQAAAWPVVQTVQHDGICVEVLAPAPGLDPTLASAGQELALRVARELGVVGVLAVELFEMPSGQLVVNELAMRPHNSGHWTIDGAVTSQFEQHLRAVLDYPLGSTTPTAPWTVMANVLGSELEELTDALPDVLARWPEARVNLYGKGIRPGRKLGHVNVSGADLAEVRRRAVGAAAVLRGEHHGSGRRDDQRDGQRDDQREDR